MRLICGALAVAVMLAAVPAAGADEGAAKRAAAVLAADEEAEFSAREAAAPGLRGFEGGGHALVYLLLVILALGGCLCGIHWH